MGPRTLIGLWSDRGRKETMHPLLFVNWASVSRMFRGLMWLLAIVLAGVIMVHLVPATPAAHHTARLLR